MEVVSIPPKMASDSARKRRFSEVNKGDDAVDDAVDDVVNQLEISNINKKKRIDYKTIDELFKACEKNNVDIIKQILKENEINPGISNFVDGVRRTPIIIAAIYNAYDVGCILVNSKIANIR